MVIGKFKFLNECIKMVSLKVSRHALQKITLQLSDLSLQYHENRPAPVVEKVLFLVQHWARNLPDEPKIKEVYNMLKKQGLTHL